MLRKSSTPQNKSGKAKEDKLFWLHPSLHSTSVLSVHFLAIFLDYSAVGKYQPNAKDLSYKSFYIEKVKDIKLDAPVSVTQN